MSRIDIDGEWQQCPHCEGDGKQDGPGGKEQCCHCGGKGEIFLERIDIEGDDE